MTTVILQARRRKRIISKTKRTDVGAHSPTFSGPVTRVVTGSRLWPSWIGSERDDSATELKRL